MIELGLELVEDVLEAVRVGVVKYVQRHATTERARNELGTKGRTADADEQQLFEVAALMKVGGEGLDVGDCAGDLVANLGCGRKVGIAKPVMAHHAFLVGVRDCAFLKRVHGGERLLHARLHGFKEAVIELDAA